VVVEAKTKAKSKLEVIKRSKSPVPVSY